MNSTATPVRPSAPSGDAAHAAFVAARAARDARLLGADEDECARVYSTAYADALASA